MDVARNGAGPGLLDQSPEQRGEAVPRTPRAAALIPPDRSGDLEHVRRQLWGFGQDLSDLYAGTGRWAGTSAGQVALALTEVAGRHQVAYQVLEGDLGLWARHKAER